MEAAVLDVPSRITPDQLTGDIRLIQTRWKQEQNLCGDLTDQGFQCYVPKQRIKRWYPRLAEWRTWEAIIFPMYVFLGDCGREEADVFYAVADTGRALRQQRISDQSRLRADLRNFEIVYGAGLGDRLQRVTNFRPGERCRVIAGPMMGLEGYVVRDGKKSKIVISLSSVKDFGVASARQLEIDRDCLEEY